tara:strand:- start:494 stop:949 length:456 start_codon:yes stop_codon:yes gene_type:complete
MVTLNKNRKKKKKGRAIPMSTEDLNWYIYNDLPLPYYENGDAERDWKFQKLLIDGEKAERIPGVYSGYHFITNFGRVLNAKMVRWITISDFEDGRYMLFHVEGHRWYLKKVMEKLGWTYDYKTLIERYNKLDYPCRKMTYSYRSQRIETQK